MPTSLHVLIVEDRPDDAELMALELRRAGFAPEWQRVDTEPDFLAALGAKPDIILSDFQLPAFTALEVLQLLQKCKNDTPCIIVTGTLGDEQAVECIKQGAADYLLKDRLALLGRAVEKALAQKNNRTKQERAEHDLVVSERRYRRLFESAKDGILILDYETGHIVDVNPFLTTMLGFSYEEMLGKTLWDIGFARDRIDAKLNFDDLKREGYVRYDDLPLETKDHRTFSVEFISNVYPVDTQNVIQCNIRDITERKQMERRAVRQDELATLGQLMSGIAHELKNPLFVLSGRLQLVSEKLAAREYDTVGTDFKTIEDAAQRMTAITQRFLNFSTPHTAQKERCAINSLLQKTVDFLSNELTKNHIQLVKSLSSNLQPVWCDPRDLQQTFTNLILNAIYAMAQANGRGTLTILTVPNEAAVEIRIQDDGSGIAPEHHAKLFDPFFTTKPADEGTGLGLWIVKSLIIGMHGTIDCESEIGKGTTFVVRLPAMPAQESS